VSVSGFKAAGTLSAEIFGTSYSTPTLHVLGGTDVIVIPERSKVLLDISQNKRVEEHEGGQLVLLCGCLISDPCDVFTGHFVPSTAKWRGIFFDYLLDPLVGIPPVAAPQASLDETSIPGNKL